MKICLYWNVLAIVLRLAVGDDESGTGDDGGLNQKNNDNNNHSNGLITDENHIDNDHNHHHYEYDMIAVTDDANYGEGRGEDMALIYEMRKLGRRAKRISIQDDDFDWCSTRMIVIRSAWNKYKYLEDYWSFIKEMDQKGAIVMNPPKVIQWQAQKASYLPQLAQVGINIPETVYFGPDDVTIYLVHPKQAQLQQILEDVLEQLGCEDIVMKPNSGNANNRIRLYPEEDDDAIDAFYATVWIDKDIAMFQCYQENIETTGERGIVVVGGSVSHGILKMPKEDHYLVNTDFGGIWTLYDPTPEEVDLAKKVASKIQEILGVIPAYLRVDVFDDNDGNLALMELAAGTANLWLSHKPEAAERLAVYLDQQLRAKEEEKEKEDCNEIQMKETCRPSQSSLIS